MIDYMDDVLLKHAHEIKPGGNPSFLHRLQSYLRLTFKKQGQWMERLEVSSGTKKKSGTPPIERVLCLVDC
jgi:hypothetical protein